MGNSIFERERDRRVAVERKELAAKFALAITGSALSIPQAHQHASVARIAVGLADALLAELAK